MDESTQFELTIFEGPAGSGKSTLIQQMVEKYPDFYSPVEPLIDLKKSRRRYSNGVDGAIESMLKDEVALVSFFQAKVSGQINTDQIGLVDRFLFSQLVYHHLREDKALPGQFLFPILQQELVSLLSVYKKVRGRLFLSPYSPPKKFLGVHFVFLLPTLSTLNRQRKQSEKKYPYVARSEIMAYQAYVDEIDRVLGLDRWVNPWYDTPWLDLKFSAYEVDSTHRRSRSKLLERIHQQASKR